MPYTVDWTSNNLEGIPNKGAITVADKAIVSTATSLVLTGKNVNGFGEYQQENFIRMLENFASQDSPSYPTVGQIWYDSANELLKVYKADGFWYGVDSAGGTVTSIGITSSTIGVSGSPITSAGNITINLPNTGVTAGAYIRANITVDAQGRVTAAADGPAVTSFGATGNNGVSVSVLNPTTTPALTIGLGAITPTSVAASGTVTGSNISGTITGTNTGDQTIILTGDVTGGGTGTFATTLANSGVTAGSYNAANITVDSKGRITAAASATSISLSGTITASNISGSSSGTNTGDQTITLTGDVTGSGTGSFAATLAASGVTPGTYGYATIIVDAKGRVTSAAANTPVTSVNISSGQLNVTGGPITSTGTISIAMPNFGIGGAYANPVNLNVDNFGRITSIANGSAPLAVSATLNSGTGYITFTNGFKIMWGTGTANSNDSTVVTYPLAFSSFSRCVCNGGPQSDNAQDNSPTVVLTTVNNFTVYSAVDSNQSISWIAVGF